MKFFFFNFWVNFSETFEARFARCSLMQNTGMRLYANVETSLFNPIFNLLIVWADYVRTIALALAHGIRL